MGDKRDELTSLFYEFKFNGRQKEVEEISWDKRFLILFQKNTWADADIMMAWDPYIIACSILTHGDVWLLLPTIILVHMLALKLGKTFRKAKYFWVFSPHKKRNEHSVQML